MPQTSKSHVILSPLKKKKEYFPPTKYAIPIIEHISSYTPMYIFDYYFYLVFVFGKTLYSWDWHLKHGHSVSEIYAFYFLFFKLFFLYFQKER